MKIFSSLFCIKVLNNGLKNKTAIAKIYKEKTLAGLEILGKAEDFNEKFLNN